ncbi:hypothetical protein CK203_057239 [Vitis vinifera]|uniref:Retrovirus-related Pol polyprotein from transposon TNT 1-94-like beta-barrel domain-containing protein n=1 Tax=Vitis vinifera TaxID=29760 RepID=A0A438HT87_VITVI|nr:hypothetical protein CK203_057239 [Vitis vinifera]
MDCHGLTSFCHGIQYLTALEIMNTPNFRKLGFLDKEDDNDTVKQFQGKDWLKISHIPKGDVKEPSQDDSEEPSEGMPALQWCHPQYISEPRLKLRSLLKSKNPHAKAQANQTSSRTTEASATADSPLASLSPAQCQQLIALLSSQLHDNTPATPELQQPGPSVSSFSGIFSFSSVSFPNSLDSSAWVLDTGATHHVCCSLPSFVSSVPASNSSVTLPNGHLVSISRIGSVQLSPHITLTDDHSQAKMIGMGKRHGNLYVLDFSSLVSQSFDISATCNNFLLPQLNFGIIVWDTHHMQNSYSKG